MTQRIEKTLHIQAPPAAVWDALTNPALMRQWMGEPEMNIEVITDWQVGSPIVIRGFHHIQFENKGTVLQYAPERLLTYDYVSSISRLPDTPGNRTRIAFTLTPLTNQTTLTLTLSNFPTASIFQHVDFYWTTTLQILKKLIESLNSNVSPAE